MRLGGLPWPHPRRWRSNVRDRACGSARVAATDAWGAPLLGATRGVRTSALGGGGGDHEEGRLRRTWRDSPARYVRGGGGQVMIAVWGFWCLMSGSDT
ncbi:putative formin-like protein 5 [Iris pallida]|uniref:Formin-like protein 5 n=1 Tax=Iris pallida TaxID=29817 RepID=A0AAX6DJ92_IRIPA|nr:putative formin-like protein 5 [Iris pallida]